jgi:glycosyltransferase involved in cell wall biosynthesis
MGIETAPESHFSTVPMKYPPAVHMLVLSGSSEQAQNIARRSYSGCEVISLPKRALRECGWRRQVIELRKLKGEAFLVFTESLEDIQEPLMLKLTIMLHRCKETVIADSYGHVQVFHRRGRWKLFPEAVLAIATDAYVLLLSWMALQVLRRRPRARQDWVGPTALEVAFLCPFPLGRVQSGGAMSHITGFLSGLARCSAPCEIFSGQPILPSSFPMHEVRYRRRFYLFRESLALSYNLHFARMVKKDLADRVPAFFYQRHGRYVVAGALLSRRLRRPLVLEYNGSEVWISKHWDPARFLPWLRICEEISLAAAALITVVSDALRQELIERGIPEQKILVNPNGVDPDIFCPDCDGNGIRQQLGFRPGDVAVGFIGSFSYWHGIGVLQEAIQLLLQEQESHATFPELRFVLIGDGPLGPEIREALDPYRKLGWVLFTGQLSHEHAPRYLAAADILISPHVPMPDGKPFFGSPTKLFEYMAMGKAIVASNLDQLARVLTHQETAWLVEPGSAKELADAIRLLASDPEMRSYLGKNARNNALSNHTWHQNAARVLSRFAETEPSPTALAQSEAA